MPVVTFWESYNGEVGVDFMEEAQTVFPIRSLTKVVDFKVFDILQNGNFSDEVVPLIRKQLNNETLGERM